MLNLNSKADASFALAIVFFIVVTEYFFRHYVLFWFPQIGSWRVNDMVSILVAYSFLVGIFGSLTAVDWKKELFGTFNAISDCLFSWKYIPWVIAMVLNIVIFSFLDRLLFANVKLPIYEAAYLNPVVWLPEQATVLKVISVIVVNGLFVPVAEEFLWRGIVQPRLGRIFPISVAISITAILFSIKHVIIDGSFSRFLVAIGFGVICGILAYRKNWNASAALHVFINTVSSITALVMDIK